MVSPTPKVYLSDDIFDQLQGRFPDSSSPVPLSPISSAMAALERRASNKSNKSLPLAQRSRTVSPSQSRLKLNLEIDTGIRSTASSPGALKRTVPPAIRTSMRPPSELFLPTPITGKGFRFSKLILEEGKWLKEDKEEIPLIVSPSLPPPISPISASIADAIARLDVHASVQIVMNNLSVPDHMRSRFDLPTRSSTAPPSTLRRQPSFLSIKSSRSLPLRAFSTRSNRPGGSSSRGAGVRPKLSPILKSRFSGIDKDVLADKRASALLAKRRECQDIPTEVEEIPKPPLRKAVTSIMPWRRKPRGETMSMLIDSGFFPIQEYIYNKTSPDTSPTKRSKLAIVVKDLPATRPSSILMTPTELYSRTPLAHGRSLRNSRRRSLAPQRRRVDQYSAASSAISPTTIVAQHLLLPPLSPFPSSPTSPLTPTKALSALNGHPLIPHSPTSPKSPQPSPGILEVIPEDSRSSMPSLPTETTPPHQTEIHLSTGTILTVKPPEFTAWRRSIYTQGPIKLPTPAIMPRKNSIASLDPFSNTLYLPNIPRRKSEDVVVDDIYSWYTAWGFENVAFAPDSFGLDTMGLEGLEVVVEAPESPVDTRFRFAATPPPPVAREFAEAMVGVKPMPGLLGVMGRNRYSSGSEASLGDRLWRVESGGSDVGGSDVGGSDVRGSDVEEVKEGWWESRRKKSGSHKGQVKAKPKMSGFRRFV